MINFGVFVTEQNMHLLKLNMYNSCVMLIFLVL